MDRQPTDHGHEGRDDAPRSAPISVRTVRVGSTATVEVAGEVDLSTASRLDEVLASDVVASADLVVIDLQDTSYLDSSGIHVVMTAQAAGEPCRLRVTNASPGIQRIFDILGVAELLT